MKILTSEMVYSSEHQFDQMDAFLNEKSSKTRSSQKRAVVPGMSLADIFVDRVSISQNRKVEYQSNYSADLSSRSSVSFQGSDQTVSHEQQSAMEKLVGGVIEKDVVIHHIQAGEDIVLKDGDAIQADQENGPQLSGRVQDQTRLQDKTWEISLKKTDIHFEEEKMSMSSLGQVTTEDGRKIDFSLEMSLNRSFVSRTQEETLIQKWQQRVNLTDPLVISLDGKAPTLSDARFEFDLDSDGQTQMVDFVNSGSGFLAFDKNNDQIINDGSELFGPGTGNGFGELAEFDEDQNHWIDENDEIFSQLSVWTRDENGKDQLISLKDAGIGAISLDYARTQFNMTAMDNSLQGQLKNSGVFLFENGKVGSVSQVDLVSGPVETEPEIKPLSAGSVAPEDPEGTGLSGLVGIVPETPPARQPENRLKALQDRINELKEQMGRLLEKMSLVSPENNGRQRGIDRYRPLSIDSSSMIPGFQSGPIRNTRRYI